MRLYTCTLNTLHNIVAATLGPCSLFDALGHLFLHMFYLYTSDSVTTTSSESISVRWIAVFSRLSLAPLGAFDSCKHMYTAAMAALAIYYRYGVVHGGTSHLQRDAGTL